MRKILIGAILGAGLAIAALAIGQGTVNTRPLPDIGGWNGQVTGTGKVVLDTSPTLVTPNIGAATASTLNGNTFTAGSSTYTGTAAQTYTFPTTSATIARTDNSNTFTGTQNFAQILTMGSAAAKSWDGGFGSVVQLTNGGLVSNGTTVRLPQNAYYNGGFKYMTTAASSSYESIGTAHDFYLAASGSADAAITYTNVLDISVKGLTVATGALGANQLRMTQGTVPTCTTNCGTGSPTVAGSDTSGMITLGTTPASAFQVNFIGTWAAAPSCVVQSALATMVVGKMPIAVVTTTTAMTVTTNGTAPATSDKYQYHCIGVS